MDTFSYTKNMKIDVAFFTKIVKIDIIPCNKIVKIDTLPDVTSLYPRYIQHPSGVNHLNPQPILSPLDFC